MKKLTALIVDDESLARKNLQMLLEEYCPELEVVGTAKSTEDAKEQINTLNPEVIFLDIRMPSGLEGFQLLDDLPNRKFQVVFTTAFKEYAVRAFKANAIHYLLKPIDINDLKEAVSKLIQTKKVLNNDPNNFLDYQKSIENLKQNMLQKKPIERLTINHTKGFKIVEHKDITYLSAEGNCTKLFFKDGSKYLDTRTLKVYEELLNSGDFYRIHK